MGLISSLTKVAVKVMNDTGRVVCSAADAAVAATSAIGAAADACYHLAKAAEISATSYRKSVEAYYSHADPELLACITLNKRLNAVARECYSHLSFLNEDNAATILKSTIYALSVNEKSAGREPRTIDKYIKHLIVNHTNIKLNMLIKEVHDKYVAVIEDEDKAQLSETYDMGNASVGNGFATTNGQEAAETRAAPSDTSTIGSKPDFSAILGNKASPAGAEKASAFAITNGQEPAETRAAPSSTSTKELPDVNFGNDFDMSPADMPPAGGDDFPDGTVLVKAATRTRRTYKGISTKVCGTPTLSVDDVYGVFSESGSADQTEETGSAGSKSSKKNQQ